LLEGGLWEVDRDQQAPRPPSAFFRPQIENFLQPINSNPHILEESQTIREEDGIKPDRLIMVTPYVEDAAVEAAKEVGVEVYMRA
jgi:hypothetical protein